MSQLEGLPTDSEEFLDRLKEALGVLSAYMESTTLLEQEELLHAQIVPVLLNILKDASFKNQEILLLATIFQIRAGLALPIEAITWKSDSLPHLEYVCLRTTIIGQSFTSV